MRDSNIDVDIIDETLLYICIDGKREHISADNARIKYAKNKQVLNMIDDVLARYKENSEPLVPAKNNTILVTKTPKQESTLKDLNNAPLENVKIVSGNKPEKKDVKPSLKDLNDAPLAIVDESKFASIYDKYNSRIRETFPTDSPSFLDVEKLTKSNKSLEQAR